MSWQFGNLRMFRYDLIVADPPWSFELYNEQSGCHKGAAHHYDTMSLDAIKALRVGDLAGPGCLLLLWGVGCMLPDVIDVGRAWGFTYKSEIVWRKLYLSGKPRMGTGYRVRSMHEPCLLFTLGSPRHKPFPSLFDGVAREHSRKPEEFFDMISRCAPELTYRAELFSRTERAGWDAWGNETNKFASIDASAIVRGDEGRVSC